MRTRCFISLSLVLAASAGAAPGIQAEFGASHFWFRNTRGEGNASPFAIDEPTKVAPFVAATYSFNDRFGLRLAYHYLDDVHTTAEFGQAPGSMLPVVVWGHFRDDVHIVSLAPELNWSLAPQLKFAIAPQLNWVASKGVVSYSTNNPLVLLVGPRGREDDGFTLGGGGPAALVAGRQRWRVVGLSLHRPRSELRPHGACAIGRVPMDLLMLAPPLRKLGRRGSADPFRCGAARWKSAP